MGVMLKRRVLKRIITIPPSARFFLPVGRMTDSRDTAIIFHL